MELKRFCLFSFLLVVMGCDLIDYHPYDSRLDTDRDINQRQIERIESNCREKDTIRFVMMGDSQLFYDETKDFVKAVNRRNDIDFVIHGGDITEFGMKKEFQWVHEAMSELSFPYVALIGNHDIVGNGESVYKAMYGETNFSFIAGNTKFVCLNTNALEYDYSDLIPDLSFIRAEIEDTTFYERTIVAMHATPGDLQFNNKVKDVFQKYIKSFPSLQFCLHGHNHSVSVTDLFNDGILYYGCSNMEKRSFLVFTLYPDKYTYEVVSY